MPSMRPPRHSSTRVGERACARFSRASARAGAGAVDRHHACRGARRRSRAIAPEPVPTSRTRGALHSKQRGRGSAPPRPRSRAAARAPACPPPAPGAGSPIRRARTRAARGHDAGRRARAGARAPRAQRAVGHIQLRAETPSTSATRSLSALGEGTPAWPRSRETSCTASSGVTTWSPRSRKRAPALLRRQRLGDLLQVSAEDRVEPVERELDAAVRDPVLGEVVGADLLRTVAASRPGPPPRAPAGGAAPQQPCPQDAHGLLLVLKLRLLVLHGDDDPGREVRDPNGRVGRVHALATGPGRAVDVDLEVVLVDLDEFLGLRHHGDRRGGGVDAPWDSVREHAAHDACRSNLKTE